MSKRQARAQASSSKASLQSNNAFGSFDSSNTANFETASSSISHLAGQPDLFILQDANIAVQFKNLAKKDSATKTRALEELQTAVISLNEAEQEHDEALLLVWIKVYPRVSIDESRRVRQLAHLVHAQVCLYSGKRVAKYMPDVVGPWYAGSHDSDKLVARAAAEAFRIVFSSTEKQAAIPRVYQVPILEFCNAAILKENPETLSDMRVTTSEDAKAKYSRVISSSVLSLCALIDNLPTDETLKQLDKYDEVLSSKILWKFLGSQDSALRRSVLLLLRRCLRNLKDLVTQHLNSICRVVFSETVFKRQSTTALDFVTMLLQLSATYPSIWIPNVNKPVERSMLFSEFVKLGSQGASEAFWKTVGDLFISITEDALPRSFETSNRMLNNVREGINSKEELRSHAEQAWTSYIRLLNRLANLTPAEERVELLVACALPILEQYLIPTSEQSKWAIQGPQAAQTILKLLRIEMFVPVTESAWPSLTEKLLEKIKTSAPEQSKDYKSSQDSIAIMSKKWFILQSHILQSNYPETFKDIAINDSRRISTECVEILQSRIGKPYGVADTLNLALVNLKTFLLKDETLANIMESFLSKDIPALIFSNSRNQLVSILYELNHSPKFPQSWNTTVEAILGTKDLDQIRSLLGPLLRSPQIPATFDLSTKNASLQAFLREEADRSIKGDGNWEFLGSLFRSPVELISPETSDYILSALVNSLTLSATASQSLAGLEMIAQQNNKTSQQVFVSEAGSELRQKILLLTESDDDSLAQKASALNDRVGIISREGIDGEVAQGSTIQVIQRGLAEANLSSLSVETLVELALKYSRSSADPDPSIVAKLVPDLGIWANELTHLLENPLPSCLSVSIPMGGMISLLDTPSPAQQSSTPAFDRSGYSPLLRKLVYTVTLLEDTDLTSRLSEETFAELLRLLLLSVQCINDKLTVLISNDLWANQDPSIEENMIDVVSRAGKLFNTWLRRSNDTIFDIDTDSPTQTFQMLQLKLWSSLQELSWPSFHHARGYSYIVTQLIDLQGWKSQTDATLEQRLKNLRQSKSLIPLIAYASAFKAPLATTKYYDRVCNEIIANVTGSKLESSSTEIYGQLVLLSLLLDNEEEIPEAMAKQRIVFFVQHVSNWLIDEQADGAMKTQICVVFKSLLPAIKDVYGELWTTVVDFLSSVWSVQPLGNEDIYSGPILSMYNACLRLFNLLNSLAMDEDSNDDLKDALTETRPKLLNGMLDLLKHLSTIPDSYNQPLQTVNELLARQIEKMPADQMGDIGELYPLIASESLAAQKCAFEIIHKQIPQQQEQISVDVVLDKRDARLPDELISLVIEGPAVDSLSDSDFLRSIPVPIRSYLSAWLLIFDHFKSASEKVRNDYVAHIREGDYLTKLLDFTFDFLGHSRGKPIDASRFDASVYSFDIEPSPVREIQWLLTHLYYLSLKRTSTLTKAWLAGCKSRQTVITVEPWTEKYLSPQLISDALATVSTWSGTQPTSDPDALTIKTNPRAKEIVVSKDIDDQVLSMAIRLPANFPLGLVDVDGVNRVALDDKKWRAFLLNTKLVILSNMSLVDGIIAFRRNVVGALKGQTECAICYAIVGSDKTLPTKKCATCANCFHGGCLFRWFSTSGSTTCPLCRNPFNYTDKR